MPADLAATQSISGSRQSAARSVAIAMYCVLLLSYVLMAADRYLFPVLAPDIRRAFGFSLANTGLLSTIFTLGLGVGGLPTGYLLSHLSRKSVILLGISIFSAATALTTVAAGFWGMFFCLAATGIGMAMLATSLFALAASYFARFRAAAIGSVNFCYGVGGFLGPIMASLLLVSYRTWRAPMLGFGAFGFLLAALILLAVRPWFSESQRAASLRREEGGASSLWNRNSILLAVLDIIHGLSMYGFLVKALRSNLASRGSGLFVTSLYGAAAFAGYLIGTLAARYGWMIAAELQIALLSILGALLALALRPDQMSL